MLYQPKPRAAAKKTAHSRAARGEAQKARTRAAIVQAAIPVFARYGPDIPVVDDFVKAAGVSRGTFYNYFETTRELLEAAMTVISDQLMETVMPAVMDEPNPVIRFATGARLFYREARLDPVLRGFLKAVANIGPLASRRVHDDIKDAIEQELISVKDSDLAKAVAVGVMIFALQIPDVETSGAARGPEMVRAILRAWGVAPALIEEAMAVTLPPLPHHENKDWADSA